MKKVPQIVICIITAIGVSGLMFLAWFLTSRHSADLHAHGVKTEATVEKLHPSQHNSFVYSFSVNGSRYEGSGRIGMGKSLNEKVPVVYDPANPKDSLTEVDLQSFVEAEPQATIQTALFCAFIGISIFWSTTFRRKRTAKQSNL